MSRRLEFVVSGDTRGFIEKDCGIGTWRSLADNGFVERTSVSCVGFHRDLEANSLLVVLPKAFNTTEERTRLREPAYGREQIYRLIRIFKKIRREAQFSLADGNTNRVLNRKISSTDPVLDSFDAALRLRRDYRENGLYIRKTPKQAIGRLELPVNWAQTIIKSTAILNDSDVLFDNSVHYARRRDMSHPLSLLQISCLKEIFKLTGERSDLDGLKALDSSIFYKVKTKPRIFFRELKASVFDDRGLFLIAAISAFLSESSLIGIGSPIREELLTYTKDFEDIWELILRDLLAPDLTKRTLLAGKWYGWPDGLPSKGMQPEFDIRLKNGLSDVLVDAKDYRVFNGSKWQGSTGDHYKQIIYRLLLGAPDHSKVVNILAFPCMGQDSLFKIRGCHHWEEIKGSRVFEVTVDYDLVVKSWLRETPMDAMNEFLLLLDRIRLFSAKLGFN